MVDQFTKWVECVPLPNQSAEETARVAINQFFCPFGFPYQSFTDIGSNFESTLFKQLCDRLQICKARTTAFKLSANGQVERFNRTLMDALRCFTSRFPAQWNKFLPQLASAIRSSVNRSTEFTPNMLMLGREINSPLDLIFPGPEPSDKVYYEQYVTNLVRNVQATHDLAREKLRSSQAIAKRDFDLKTFTRSYSVCDAVYILNTSTPKGKCSKLRPKWKGSGCSTEMTGKKSLFCLRRGPDNGDFMIQCEESMSDREETTKRAWKEAGSSRQRPKANKFEALIKPGESLMDCVRRFSDNHIMVKPKSLYMHLVTQSNDDLKKGSVLQYKVAKTLGLNIGFMR
ncbi:uncharacterized protein LOC134271731 [Saccostrea cucullata]|uniref:uncharacterized protein LOC134271731 n=1 Tax=Saccostrea cuccullata TaxID=36930 RepID=UPI002ED359A4